MKDFNIKKLTSQRLFLPVFCLVLVLLVNIMTTPDFFSISIRDGVLYGYIIDIINRASELVILAIGMIVDNSIVILESCSRYRAQGLSFQEAAAQGTSTMLMSILAGTLTTVVVYVPLSISQGMAGMMFGPLLWTIILTLLAFVPVRRCGGAAGFYPPDPQGQGGHPRESPAP